MGAQKAAATSIFLRPTRSAKITKGSENTIPNRATVPATPWASSDAPNSSAAKFTVWVNSVLR